MCWTYHNLTSVLGSSTELVIIGLLGVLFGTCAANVCIDAGLETTDGFLPNATDCTMYVSCFKGLPYDMACPINYFFDPTLVKCSATYVCPAPSTCPETGIVKQPVAGVCAEYSLCIDGTAYPKTCAAGLAFSEAKQNCVLAADAGCIENKCATITTDPKIYGDDVCSANYYICDKAGEPIAFTCDTGLIFDATVLDCIVGECPVV